MKYYKKGDYIFELKDDATYPHYSVTLAANSDRYREIEAYLAKHPDALIPEPSPPKPTEAELAERARQATLARLAELDRLVPRALEDLIIASGKKPHEKTQAVIDEKNALRAKL